METRLLTGLLALLVLVGAAHSATAVNLPATVSKPGEVWIDLGSVTIGTPSKSRLEGAFHNIAEPSVVGEEGADGSSFRYSFTNSPIDRSTSVFAAGDYTFAALAYAEGASTDAGAPAVTLPLPAAAWLFGPAILGFAVFSTSRRG